MLFAHNSVCLEKHGDSYVQRKRFWKLPNTFYAVLFSTLGNRVGFQMLYMGGVAMGMC